MQRVNILINKIVQGVNTAIHPHNCLLKVSLSKDLSAKNILHISIKY